MRHQLKQTQISCHRPSWPCNNSFCLPWGLQRLLSSMRTGAPCGASSLLSAAGVDLLVMGSIVPEMKGKTRTLASSASRSVVACVAAPWLMREQPAVLCQDVKVSGFSVITALASHLLSACETKLTISCESRWF